MVAYFNEYRKNMRFIYHVYIVVSMLNVMYAAKSTILFYNLVAAQ
jgi:hypothetical protein